MSSHRLFKAFHRKGSFNFSSLSRFNIESSVQLVQTNSSNNIVSFTGQVSDKWSIGQVPNGGLMMCLAINGAKQCVSHPDPLTFTAYYLKPTIENHPIELQVRTISQTKSTSTVHIQLIQEDIVRSEYIGMLGSLSDMKGLNYSCKSPPVALQNVLPFSCFSASEYLFQQYPQELKINQMIDLRIPYSEPFVQAIQSNTDNDHINHHNNNNNSNIDCWIRFHPHSHPHHKPSPPSIISYALLQDIFPPTPLFISFANSWVATLQYTVHFWSPSPPSAVVPDNPEFAELGDWVQAKVATEYVQDDGRLVTDSELWSSDGSQLLSTSRQLAKILTIRKE